MPKNITYSYAITLFDKITNVYVRYRPQKDIKLHLYI